MTSNQVGVGGAVGSGSITTELSNPMAVYEANRPALEDRNAPRRQVGIRLFASDPSSKEREICMLEHVLTATFNGGANAWVVALSANPGWVVPQGPSNVRHFRVECHWPETMEVAATVQGTARIAQGGDVMSLIDSQQGTSLFIHIIRNQVCAFFLKFATGYHHPQQHPPQPSQNNTDSISPTTSTNSDNIGSSTPRPLALHLLTNDFEDNFRRDAWKVLSEDGEVLAKRLSGINKAEADTVTIGIIAQGIADQNILLRVLKEPAMRPSAQALFQSIRQLPRSEERETLVQRLFQVVDFEAMASNKDMKGIFEFLVNECCSPRSEDDISFVTVGLLIAVNLAPSVTQRLRDPVFAESLSILVKSGLRPSLVRQMFLATLQSPVSLMMAANDQTAVEVLILVLSREDCPQIIEDCARTLGFGRKRLVVAMGTDANGSRFIAEVVKRSSRTTELRDPLFDFRDALNESAARLAVHPNGNKVIKECLDHPFFRDSILVRLFMRDPQDLLPRGASALLYGLESETDVGSREWYAEQVMRHAALMAKDDHDKFAMMSEQWQKSRGH